MHYLKRHGEIVLAPFYEERSEAFTRCSLIDSSTGSVHMGFGLCRLEQGSIDAHLHSFEESFFVLEGEPVLYLDSEGIRLCAGACGVVPVGVESHASPIPSPSASSWWGFASWGQLSWASVTPSWSAS